MEEAKSDSEGTKNNPLDKSKKKSILKYCLHFIQRESVQRSGNLTEVGSGLPPQDFQGLNSRVQDWEQASLLSESFHLHLKILKKKMKWIIIMETL